MVTHAACNSHLQHNFMKLSSLRYFSTLPAGTYGTPAKITSLQLELLQVSTYYAYSA